MITYLVPIVEGQTEQRCVIPLLMRVWTQLLNATESLEVLRPIRCARDALLGKDPAVLTKKIADAMAELARRMKADALGHPVILFLLDAEADLPCLAAPALLQRAKTIRADIDIRCVFAKRMLENWIIAGAKSLGGFNGLPNPVPLPSQFEECSGANWLKRLLRTPERSYDKLDDAKKFLARIDLAECRRNAPSFDKLCRELESLHLPTPPPQVDADEPPPA